MTSTLRLSDGRQIRWHDYGASPENSDPHTVLALHGTPGSYLKYKPVDAAARERGLHILAVDRWGYGGTDAPGRWPSARAKTQSGEMAELSLHQFARDIEALMRHRGIARYSVVGISGGGPYAAAVASANAGAVAKLALVAPVGIIRREETVLLSAFHWFCFRGIARIPTATRAVFAGYRVLHALSPKLAIAAAMTRSGPADRDLLGRPEIVGHLSRMMREGLSRSTRGPAIDLKLFAEPWDVDPADIRAPTRIWFGDQDGSVPRGGIDALAEVIPTATFVPVTGQGHFWIATRFPVVLDWLAERDKGHGAPIEANSDPRER
ncbi:MAG: alpha/beta hydrolase [Pseudomonadota bacterium]